MILIIYTLSRNIKFLVTDTPRNDLLVSFDGLSVHLPPEKTKRGWL